MVQSSNGIIDSVESIVNIQICSTFFGINWVGGRSALYFTSHSDRAVVGVHQLSEAFLLHSDSEVVGSTFCRSINRAEDQALIVISSRQKIRVSAFLTEHWSYQNFRLRVFFVVNKLRKNIRSVFIKWYHKQGLNLILKLRVAVWKHLNVEVNLN